MTGLDALIGELEEATEGSGWLDTKICEVCEIGYGHLPHFTRSLDAELPGENIIDVNYSERRHPKPWHATHLEGTVRHWGVAATEAIARRLARLEALKAGAASDAQET